MRGLFHQGRKGFSLFLPKIVVCNSELLTPFTSAISLAFSSDLEAASHSYCRFQHQTSSHCLQGFWREPFPYKTHQYIPKQFPKVSLSGQYDYNKPRITRAGILFPAVSSCICPGENASAKDKGFQRADLLFPANSLVFAQKYTFRTSLISRSFCSDADAISSSIPSLS